MSTRRRVAVVGGGLTGLATAWHLREDHDVTVLEASERVGGQLRSVELDGAPLDVGADAYLARRPEAEALVRAVGFGDEDLVAPATGRVALWVRGGLRQLPEGTVLGAPADLRSLAASGALSPGGLARAALEPLLPRRQVVGDRSVADLVGERFGREVVDTLVEPLLGGVYAGAADRLSARAAAPPIWQAATTHRSLLAGLAAHRARTASDGRPVFRTLRGGLPRLAARLVEELGSRVRTGHTVRAVERVSSGGWRVRCDDGWRRVDQVVLALPPAPASRLLAPVCREAARELAGVRTASVGVVALSYASEDAADAPLISGVLVPRAEGRLIKAVTVSSRKWPHLASRDRFVLRASVGRIDDDRAERLDDDALADRVDAEVRWALRLRAPARDRRVVRWGDALPQYEVGHVERVERIRHALDHEAPGLHLGGAALDGVGLAARAGQALQLADAVRAQGGTAASAGRG